MGPVRPDDRRVPGARPDVRLRLPPRPHSPRPGILDDVSGAYDSPEKTVDGWAALIPRLTWLEGDQVAAFAGSGPLITDDRPLPEYFLLRRMFGEESPPVTPKSLAEAGFPFR